MQIATIEFPASAPGCYAAPSVFSHDSQVCNACPTFDACASECVKTLQALREKINVEDILARHSRAIEATKPKIEAVPQDKPDFSKFLRSVKEKPEKVKRKVTREETSSEISAEDAAVIATIPQAKAKKLATTWCKRGLMPHIRAELQAGRNPFASQDRQSHESVVCGELLNGAVTASSLIKAFMSKLGSKEPWEKSSASAHVRIAMPILVAFGIVEETSEGWVLVPVTGSDNV